jgi:hypothetical protein
MKISPERIALTHELHALVIDYWHDVDTNWGHNAPGYYTEDGVFEGTRASYKGREKIRAFYKWREDRGARTVVHAVHNFQALPDGPDKATCHWFLMLYAADGKPILPTHPPIQIAYMTDHCVKDRDGNWLVKYRKFENWFEGGIPSTNPNLDDR